MRLHARNIFLLMFLRSIRIWMLSNTYVSHVYIPDYLLCLSRIINFDCWMCRSHCWVHECMHCICSPKSTYLTCDEAENEVLYGRFWALSLVAISCRKWADYENFVAKPHEHANFDGDVLIFPYLIFIIKSGPMCVRPRWLYFIITDELTPVKTLSKSRLYTVFDPHIIQMKIESELIIFWPQQYYNLGQNW